MSFFPQVSADQLFAASGVAEYEGSESDGCNDATEVVNLLKVSRALGFVQTMPKKEQERVYAELAAKYLPRLTAAFRKHNSPNNAPVTLINTIGHTPYFMRFSKTPAASDLARIQAKRMATEELINSEDDHGTVAEICQFLSTLLVVFGAQIDQENLEPLLKRLKAWRKHYKGRFAEETAGRCIAILDSDAKGPEAHEMMVLLPLMRMTLSLGTDMCMIKGCPTNRTRNTEDSTHPKELLQCSRCRTTRYCGQEHQKQDWPQHKHKCFSPVF